MTNSDFQRSSTEQGRRFEEAVEVLALIDGFEIKERRWEHPAAKVEIDLVLWRADLGEIYVECKGSWRGKRPGLGRTDTLRKAISSAWLLRQVVPADQVPPYWLVVSHLPTPGSRGAAWLEVAEAAHLFDRVIAVGLVPPPDLVSIDEDDV